MRNWKQYSIGLILSSAMVVAAVYLRPASISAQPVAVATDVGTMLAPSIATKVVTIKIENQRGEPRLFTGRTAFDRPVQAYWVSLVGADVKFTQNNEKQINREMFSVDPFAKIINAREVEVSGKLGIRDGSGDWDDPYEGTLTVAVTAILSR